MTSRRAEKPSDERDPPIRKEDLRKATKADRSFYFWGVKSLIERGIWIWEP